MVTDQRSDKNGMDVWRLTKIVDPPMFVKTASETDRNGDDNLPMDAFADTRRQKFAVHTPAATWLSTAFFLMQKKAYRKGEAEMIDKRLDDYAAFHGISNATKYLRAKFAAWENPVEKPLTADDVALTVKHPDGKVEYFWPIRNPVEIKTAAAYLEKHRDTMPFEMRHEFATRLLEKAADCGLDTTKLTDSGKSFAGELEKMAGHGTCSISQAADACITRARAARRPAPGANSAVVEAFLKLAKACFARLASARQPATLLKLASVMDQFDRMHHLEKSWGPDFPRPEDVFFGLTKSALETFRNETVRTTTNKLYKQADLERLRVREIRDRLGDEYADDISEDGIHVSGEKCAAVVPTMPRPDAVLFDRLCGEKGIPAYEFKD